MLPSTAGSGPAPIHLRCTGARSFVQARKRRLAPSIPLPSVVDPTRPAHIIAHRLGACPLAPPRPAIGRIGEQIIAFPVSLPQRDRGPYQRGDLPIASSTDLYLTRHQPIIRRRLLLSTRRRDALGIGRLSGGRDRPRKPDRTTSANFCGDGPARLSRRRGRVCRGERQRQRKSHSSNHAASRMTCRKASP